MHWEGDWRGIWLLLVAAAALVIIWWWPVGSKRTGDSGDANAENHDNAEAR